MRHVQGPLLDFDYVSDGGRHWMGHVQGPLLDLIMFRTTGGDIPLLDFIMYRTDGAIAWVMLKTHFLI